MSAAAREIRLPYEPQPRQQALHETEARLILYGGAAGGGKSTAGRWDLIRWCLAVPGLQAYLFRRTLPALEQNHIVQIRNDIPRELGQWVPSKNRFQFHNGSVIRMCYCDRESDVEQYQGAEIHVLAMDEAGQFTAQQITYLLTRCRLGDFSKKVPAAYRPYLPRVVLTANPGGVGHSFLKRRFIEQAPPNVVFEDADMGWPAIFLPARMADNIYLDAAYEKQFNGIAPELARALRDGDWDAVVGQALPSLTRDKHMLRPFKPPRHWARFTSMDWGSAKPFSVGWYCVSDGATLPAKDDWPEVYLPPGALIRYREWYGWSGREDEGVRMESPAVARGILKMEEDAAEAPMDYRVLDSAAWAQTDGPSVYERMYDATDGRFSPRQAQKDLTAGYAEWLARLAGGDDGPMLFVTANCTHFWRTVPPLILDDINPEKGPAQRQENHVYDEVSYALRSRPYVMTESDRDMQEIESLPGIQRRAYQQKMRKREQRASKAKGRYAVGAA